MISISYTLANYNDDYNGSLLLNINVTDFILSSILQMWSYSKVFSGLSSWRYTDAPSIVDHMMSCDYIKANVKTYTPDMILKMH